MAERFDPAAEPGGGGAPVARQRLVEIRHVSKSYERGDQVVPVLTDINTAPAAMAKTWPGVIAERLRQSKISSVSPRNTKFRAVFGAISLGNRDRPKTAALKSTWSTLMSKEKKYSLNFRTPAKTTTAASA